MDCAFVRGLLAYVVKLLTVKFCGFAASKAKPPPCKIKVSIDKLLLGELVKERVPPITVIVWV